MLSIPQRATGCRGPTICWLSRLSRRGIHSGKARPQRGAEKRARKPEPLRLTGRQKEVNTTTMLYVASAAILSFGVSYAAVPLYKVFCQSTGAGGEIQSDSKIDKVRDMEPIPERPIRIKFVADTRGEMQWSFEPVQDDITIVPGETALAFFTAKNPTSEAVTGISTYNVLPFQAGLYFNKIQCFCFEEQRLNAGEEVDMPVFFYVDPDIYDDPNLYNTDEIILSYTFFKAKTEGAPRAQFGQHLAAVRNPKTTEQLQAVPTPAVV